MEGVGTYLLDDPHVGGVVVTSRDVTERKQAEEKLWFQARLLEAVGEAVIALNMEGKVLYWNRAAEGMYGWSAEEAMGHRLIEMVVPEGLRERAEDIAAQLREGRNWTGEFVVRRKDGTTFPVEGTNTPVFGEDGELVGVIGMIRDITERKRAEEALKESEQRFGSAFRDAAIGMALVGTDGRFLQVNCSLCKILGYSEEELLEKTFQEITHPDDLRADIEQVRRMLVGEIETYQTEKRYFHKEGNVVWGLLSISLVHDEGGEPLYFISQAQDVTERVRAEDRLRQTEDRYRALVERMPAVVYIQEVGSPDSALYMSPQIEALTGYTPEECKDPGLRWGMVHPDDRERMQAEDERTGELGEVFTNEYRVLRRDGRTVWVRNESVLVEEEEGGSRYWQGFMVDITERKRSEGLIRQQAALLEQTHDAVFMWKLGGEITYWNQGAERIYGWSKEEALGRISHELLNTIHPFAPEELVCTLRRDGHWEGELVHHARDGRRVVVESRHVLAHYDSEPEFVLQTNRDITDRKRAEDRLRYQAHHDLLTDLPNRQLFLDRLGQALGRTRRRPGSKVALVFVDLDNFKVVNDSLGHEVGDLLLVRVGERLRRCLRPEDTLARFGGDEFAMLLENVQSPKGAVRAAERIIEELRNPFMLEGRELILRASVGIAMGHDRSKTPGELLKDADTAMYRAKEDGVGYRVFELKMHEMALIRLKLENDMSRAIEVEEFVVNYQPIVHLRTGEAWGSEALVRWKHPERGLLDPSQFVPVAEETGLIVPLGERVLEEACRQAVEWQRGRPEAIPPVVCVNLSAKQLRRQDLVETVRGVLQSTGLTGRCLCLDITETLYITVLEGSTTVLDDLKRMGVRISVDDFGTGYSSLSYLKRLPADSLKIDKSFVVGLGENVQDTAIVQMVINLAHSLGMGTVAEGVESEEQAEQLRQMGCDLGQGYHFARPLPPEEASEFLTR
jgi:diguanylate cyclase (GGDEF)-like protein/PAS domain S-box-containing protein